MKCSHCAFESEQIFEFCPACGTPVQQEPVSRNVAADKILAALKDNLFLAICVLFSVSFGLPLLSGSFQLVDMLTMIFLWLVYVGGRKGLVDVKNMRHVSGTIYANYVINYVLFSLLAVAGVLVGVVLTVVANNSTLLDLLQENLASLDLSVDISSIFHMVFALSGWIIAVVFLIVAAVGFIINIFGLRKIHRLAKTAYQSVGAADIHMIENADGAKIWLWVFGIFAAISALSSLAGAAFLAALANGCRAAALILAALLVQKYISNDTPAL